MRHPTSHWFGSRTRSTLQRESLEARRLLAGNASDEPAACDPVGSGVLVASETVGSDSALPAGRTAVDALPARQLRMFLPANYQPGVPVLVRVQIEDGQGQVDRSQWDATVQLTTSNPSATITPSVVSLVNGMGSALVTLEGGGAIDVSATFDQMVDQRQIEPYPELPIPQISGTLTGASTHLQGIIQVTGDLLVPEGHVLTIDPGTLIMLDGVAQGPQLRLGTRIVVEGTVEALGTAEQPITFTATDPELPWGEIDIAGGSVLLRHTNLNRAGTSARGGHTNSGPALRLRSDGSLELEHSNITDLRGKVLQGTSGELVIHHSLLSRAVMGPEIEDTSLDFADSWIIEMAGVYHPSGIEDDNDGIYLHEQEDGQTIVMRRSVVADVQDDGIDTLGSTVLLDDVIVRETVDKSMSVFNGVVTVANSLLVNGEIGIEAKGSGQSTADVIVDRTTIANMDHGIRAFDKDSPDPNVRITFAIANSIIHVRPGGDPLFTDYDPNDIKINYSWVEEAWPHDGSGAGMVQGGPLFVNSEAHDYRLAEGSPAIDAGDPDAAADADGSRADLGYPGPSSSGSPADFNNDGQIDAADIDLLCAALQAQEDDLTFDLDGNRQLDDSDLNYLVLTVLKTTYGDANLDGVFNSSDLVLVFQAGEYEDAESGNSGWATGDWNCDGEFGSGDLVAAFQAGSYE